jgi:hypothetical protein
MPFLVPVPFLNIGGNYKIIELGTIEFRQPPKKPPLGGLIDEVIM